MLRVPARVQTWRYIAFAVGLTTIMLSVWIGLELQQLRSAESIFVMAPGSVTGSFAFMCRMVGPSLPYISAALVPSALIVMAPCLLQMSIVLVTAITGTTVASAAYGLRPLFWRQGLMFGGGFLSIYTFAALVLGLVGQMVIDYAFILKALGGSLIFLLGLAVLHVLPRGALSGCRGPRLLLMTGKATLRKPFGAGVAFAVYCVGCCGPYLSGLALLSAGSGSFWQRAALMLGFALLMGALLLLPIFALPASYRLGQALMRRARLFSVLSGVALVVIGTALTLEPLIIWILVRA